MHTFTLSTLYPPHSTPLHPPSDRLSKLAAHVEVASRLNGLINERALTELGKLEQVGGLGWAGRGWGLAASV